MSLSFTGLLQRLCITRTSSQKSRSSILLANLVKGKRFQSILKLHLVPKLTSFFLYVVIKPGSKGPLTALKRPERSGRRSRRNQKASASPIAAKDISTDAAVVAVLSELCGIFTLKAEQKNNTMLPLMVKVFLLCSQLRSQNSGNFYSWKLSIGINRNLWEQTGN